MLRKEARLIEIFENDRGNGRFGNGVGTWGLCATQGGCDSTYGENRKINPVPGNLPWAVSPRRPGRFFGLAFFSRGRIGSVATGHLHSRAKTCHR